MKRYHTYKDSGIKWIGEVPEGWSGRQQQIAAYLDRKIGSGIWQWI